MWASDLRTQGSGCCMSPCPSPAFSSQLDHLHSCPFSILVPYIRFQWKKGLYVLKGVQKPDLHKNLHLEKRTQKSRGVIQLAHSHTVGSWHRRGPASPCPTALGQSGQWCRAQPQVTPQISATLKVSPPHVTSEGVRQFSRVFHLSHQEHVVSEVLWREKQRELVHWPWTPEQLKTQVTSVCGPLAPTWPQGRLGAQETLGGRWLPLPCPGFGGVHMLHLLLFLSPNF